jgi:hypothetical protein
MKIQFNLKTYHALIGGSFCNQYMKIKISALNKLDAERFFNRVWRPTFDGVNNRIESVNQETLRNDAFCNHFTPASHYMTFLTGLTPDQKINQRVNMRATY